MRFVLYGIPYWSKLFKIGIHVENNAMQSWSMMMLGKSLYIMGPTALGQRW